MTELRNGDVWWAEQPEIGRRPFVVLTRNAAIPLLNSVLVAPITRTIRGIPTEVPLSPDDGLPQPCAATLDNLRVMSKALLVDYQCSLSVVRRHELCLALNAAVDC